MKKLLVAAAFALSAPAAFAQAPTAPPMPTTGPGPASGPAAAAMPNMPRMAPPGPEQMRQMMEMQMGAMIPIIARLGDALIESQLAAAEKPETAKRIVTFKKNVYDGLLKQGFTKEQALAITVATQPPSANPVLR